MRPRRLAALAALGGALLLSVSAPTALARPAEGSGSGRARLIVKPGGLIVQTRAYQVVLSKTDGELLAVIDRRNGTRLVKGQNGCEWGADSTPNTGNIGGCSPAGGVSRFSYHWNRAAQTLRMTYAGDASTERYTNAVVTLTARATYFDLRLTLENHRGATIAQVLFPSDLYVDAHAVRAGYAPNFLPGVRLGPRFFTRVGKDVERYPSRWAFADYLALDVGKSKLALYSVNPPPSPIAPADLGFLRNSPPVPCSGPVFCLTHVFQTWIRDGGSWQSPVVRVRVGAPVQQTVLAYRKDNRIDTYPSLAAKVGPLLPMLARAPLIKADPWKGLPPFSQWNGELGRLPSPALVHPVAFQPGGQDESHPDFLPPDPRWGTSDDLRAAIASAHAHGQLVMPYLNVSWWDDRSPTLQNLPPPLTARDISMQDGSRRAVDEQYGDHNGYIVSPAAPFVRDRIAALLDQWRTEVPVDCLFFDQIGARIWRRDFNPAEPTTLAYNDSWLSLMAPYANRCLQVEDGWDRLAASFSGFHGGLMLMEREFVEPDRKWGEGNWDPFPLALWLFHDKVLLYQHDLYEGTMTADPEVLTWNEAFGFMLSYSWDVDAGTLSSPWLEIAGRFQRALGPYYAGVPLTRFEDAASGVTRTVFSGYSVVANWRAQPYTVAGYTIAPGGFLARSADGKVVAGALTAQFGVPLSAGTQYLIVENGRTTFSAGLRPAG